VIRRWDWKKGRKRTIQRIRSHMYFSYGRQSRCVIREVHAWRICVRREFLSTPNYVIVTRGRLNGGVFGNWSSKYTSYLLRDLEICCVQNVTQLIFKCPFVKKDKYSNNRFQKWCKFSDKILKYITTTYILTFEIHILKFYFLLKQSYCHKTGKSWKSGNYQENWKQLKKSRKRIQRILQNFLH